MDVDIVVDSCLYLWSKCRPLFAKIQTGSTDVSTYIKALHKTEQPQKVHLSNSRFTIYTMAFRGFCQIFNLQT